MPKIVIIKNTVCNCKPVFVGEVIEASDRDTRYLIALNKAKIATEKTEAPAVKKEPKK